MKANSYKTTACPTCNGSGRITDNNDIAAKMRQRREAAGLSLRELARRLKLSVGYMSDLELGRRNWNAAIIKRVEAQL
jgi:predicted transcriptional regulator